MSLIEKRTCVFCGRRPDTKTREHVVPFWALEMSGDPTRVVTFGQNFEKDKKVIQFSWSNFVAPSCQACNNRFAELEARAKEHVSALRERAAIPVSSYIELMDWLDKVRIGIWLTRHMLENHPIQISPNFHISSRVAQKDRMIAVYVFDSTNRGINLFGSDSLIFSGMPSCFGFRINDLLMLSISADFFCSRGCGLPYPKLMKIIMGGPNAGMLRLEGVALAKGKRNPVTDLKLFKPVVWLYQPIKLPSSDPVFQGGYYGHYNLADSRIARRTLLGNDRQGALFRQLTDRVEVLAAPETMIEFDSVVGVDCAQQKDIAASIYDAQIDLYSAIEYEWHEPGRPNDFDNEYEKLKFTSAAQLSEFYRNMGHIHEVGANQ